MHHGRRDTNRIKNEPPLGILYGFRGREKSVDLLSPYEMLLHYSMERILPPTNALARSRAEWTEEGRKYHEQ